MEGNAPAPAGPAVTTPTTSPNTNGAHGPQNPVAKPPPRPNVQAGQAGQPDKPESKPATRDASGKFVSGDSGTAKKPEATPEKPPEPYRFKRKLKDGDREEEVDLDEEALAREVSIARAAKRRLGEMNRRLEELAAREAKLAEREKQYGDNPEEYAAKVLAQKAQRGLMSPEERRIAELEEQLQGLQTKEQQREQERKQAEAEAQENERWKRREPQMLAAIQKHRLPKDMSVLGFIGKVGEELGRALDTDDPEPDMVVAEANERLGKFAEHYVLSLPVEALVAKLGPARMKALHEWTLSEWRKRSAAADPVPQMEEKPPAPPAPDEPKRYLSQAEVDERLRKLRESLK